MLFLSGVRRSCAPQEGNWTALEIRMGSADAPSQLPREGHPPTTASGPFFALANYADEITKRNSSRHATPDLPLPLPSSFHSYRCFFVFFSSLYLTLRLSFLLCVSFFLYHLPHQLISTPSFSQLIFIALCNISTSPYHFFFLCAVINATLVNFHTSC